MVAALRLPRSSTSPPTGGPPRAPTGAGTCGCGAGSSELLDEREPDLVVFDGVHPYRALTHVLSRQRCAALGLVPAADVARGLLGGAARPQRRLRRDPRARRARRRARPRPDRRTARRGDRRRPDRLPRPRRAARLARRRPPSSGSTRRADRARQPRPGRGGRPRRRRGRSRLLGVRGDLQVAALQSSIAPASRSPRASSGSMRPSR